MQPQAQNKTVLTAKNLRGNWATLLLPIDASDRIDAARLAEEIDFLVHAGVDGIYSNGTAGEFHNQTEEEFDQVQKLLADKCHRQDMRFQIGASHPSPIISLERLKRGAGLQPDAFQVILPDWLTVTPGEQVSFLTAIAEAAGAVPLVLYNPPHAKQVLTPAVLWKLAECVPQLIGIKVGLGTEQWFEEMRKVAGRLSVFVPGHLLATGMNEKIAAGAYSNVACLSPAGAQVWWNMILSDLPAALEVEDCINRFFTRCIVPFKEAGYSNPALDKFLAAVGGWSGIGTRLRWPYRWIPMDEVPGAQREAKKLLPSFFF